MVTTKITGVDYAGNVEYTVLKDGQPVGTLVKVQPDNFRFFGASASRPWRTVTRRGYALTWVTLKSAAQSIAQ